MYKKVRNLAWLNLMQKKGRTTGLVLIVAVMAFACFSGLILDAAIQNGLNSLKARFGADIMAVPLECKTEAEGMLIQGQTGYFYMNQNVVEQLSKVDGVKAVSPQFYLTSSNMGCCDITVQFIGFDPNTDFSVIPWIAQTYSDDTPGKGNLIVGSDIPLKYDNTLTFYGQSFPVAAKLEETGTCMDQSVYADIDTIRHIFKAAQEKGFSFTESVNPDCSISSVMIRLKDGYTVDEVKTNIRRQIDGLQLVEEKSMLIDVADSLGVFAKMIILLEGVLFLSAVVILAVIFRLSVRERRREYAVLRMMGASRRQVRELVLTEAAIISLLGVGVGITIAALAIFPFSGLIAHTIHLPFLLPKIEMIFAILACALLSTFMTCCLAVCGSAKKAGKVDIYLLIHQE
ncbi:MAG TPA: ABC transporter permease [Lachnospiraceae bacterium]|nr:ABC transporter permease [Lachnospiraceae bacterium]